DFSKLDAGAVEIEEVAFDLTTLLESTLEIVAPKARAKSLDLVIDIAKPTPRFLRGDPGRIRQVLLNLLGNAVKFTQSGSVKIVVTPQEQTAQSIHLRLDVRDTGVGMAADRLDRLFQSFSQADASVSRRFGGTGLGLAISKKLVERMGGSIGVESAPG